MEYLKNISLKEHNSFRTEALAKYFCNPGSISEIQQCLTDFASEPKLILGGGCNIFFTHNFEGVVIKPELKGVKELLKNGKSVLIEAMASENWDQFVADCVAKGYSGIENLSLIPGTVGASPVQNIGAYGSEVKDVIREVRTIHIPTGELKVFTNSKCQFAYRDSLFKHSQEYIITSVVFELKKEFSYTPKYKDLNLELAANNSPSLQEVRNAIINIRRRKLPDEKILPNCGSFFKNPYITKEQSAHIMSEFPDLPVFPHEENTVKTSAAFLIDKAGFKGVRKGEVGTYPNQPLIIVNYGTEKGEEIVKFMQEIQHAVQQRFNVSLEPEVRIL